MKNNGSRYVLAKARMRHSKGDRLGRRGMFQEHFVYLPRRDVFTTAVNHLFLASCEVEVALLIDAPQVASPEPAVGECRAVGFGIVDISRGHIGTADDDLTGFICGKQVALLVIRGPNVTAGYINNAE